MTPRSLWTALVSSIRSFFPLLFLLPLVSPIARTTPQRPSQAADFPRRRRRRRRPLLRLFSNNQSHFGGNIGGIRGGFPSKFWKGSEAATEPRDGWTNPKGFATAAAADVWGGWG